MVKVMNFFYKFLYLFVREKIVGKENGLAWFNDVIYLFDGVVIEVWACNVIEIRFRVRSSILLASFDCVFGFNELR